MPSIVKTLKVVADPNRLRILLLLKSEELSVAELQETLAMGQSTISTHLSQLKQAELVEDRRTGKSNLYRLFVQPAEAPGFQAAEKREADKALYQGTTSVVPQGQRNKEWALAPEKEKLNRESFVTGHEFTRADKANQIDGAGRAGLQPSHSSPEGSFLSDLLARAAIEIPEAAHDQAAMRRVLKKRQDKTRAFFDSVAGRLGKDYVPGKSWKSLAEALLRLVPPMVIADLGAGEGSSALLLSQRAVRVIAVDSSAKMIEVAREQALRHGVKNVDYRLGDIEEIPIADGEADLVWISQSLHHALHPARALAEARRILAPGGRIVILDLVKHRFEEAREIYADEWLGFSEAELESMLEKAGFTNIETTVVDKEPETPQFQTLLAVGDKAS